MKHWIGWACAFWIMSSFCSVEMVGRFSTSREWIVCNMILASILATAVWGIFY